MTPSARVQAAIELLDAIVEAARNDGAPADRLISQYFRERRYAGSKDRRAVRELVYRAIRICGDVPQDGRAAMLALGEDDPAIIDLFDGSTHGPAPVRDDERAASRGVAPGWLMESLERSGLSQEAIASLTERAPLDVRVNTLKADRDSLELPVAGELLEAPQGLRFEPGTPVEQWDAYRDGRIEVQDHGSQLVCLAADAKPGETVIDLCAGAGGKTLALAAAMKDRGELIASDTDRARLSRLDPRAQRAGLTNLRTVLLDPGAEIDALEHHIGKADLVLVDAPCSGTGTWRRKPEAKWRLTPERLERYCALQDRLLEVAAKLTKPGGRIVFITCSLLDAEGAERVDAFLKAQKQWKTEAVNLPRGRPHRSGYRLEPFHDGTDGFFVAILRSS